MAVIPAFYKYDRCAETGHAFKIRLHQFRPQMPDCLQAAFLPAEQIGKGVAPGKKEGSDQLVVIGFSIKRTFVLYHLLRNKKQIGKPVVTGVGAVYCPKPFQGLTVGMCQSVFTGCAAGFLHVDYLAAADVGFHQLRMPRGEGKSQNAAP